MQTLEQENIQENIQPFSASLFPLMVFFNFFALTTYGIPVAFYPNLALSKGVDSTITGIIFAMFPVGALLSAMFIGKTLHLFSKKYLLIIFQITLALSFICLGLGYYIDDEYSFIILGLLSRTVQGASIGCFVTILYSLVPDYWPNELQKRISILEMSVGLGVGIGPFIGAGLSYLGFYVLIYVIPGLVILVCGALISPFVFPSKNNQDTKELKHLSLTQTYFNSGIMVTLLVIIINYGNLCFLMPIFENHIIDMGGDSTLAAILVGISQVGFFAGGWFIIIVKTEKRKYLFAVGLVLNVVCCVIMSFPNYYPIACAMIILGVSNSFTNIPDIPENIEYLTEVFPNEEEGQITDMASGVYVTSISFAEFFGSIIGGVLGDLTSFDNSMFIYAGISLLFFFFYLAFMRSEAKRKSTHSRLTETEEDQKTEK